MWGLIETVAICGEVGPTQVICKNEDDVGPGSLQCVCLILMAGKKQASQAKKQKEPDSAPDCSSYNVHDFMQL
jgi:hypothetical protein